MFSLVTIGIITSCQFSALTIRMADAHHKGRRCSGQGEEMLTARGGDAQGKRGQDILIVACPREVAGFLGQHYSYDISKLCMGIPGSDSC